MRKWSGIAASDARRCVRIVADVLCEALQVAERRPGDVFAQRRRRY